MHQETLLRNLAMHTRHWQYFYFHIGKQKKTLSRTESTGKITFEQNAGSFTGILIFGNTF